MESKTQSAGLQPQRVPLPSIHLHPSLSTSSRHQQTSTTLNSPQSAATSRPSEPRLPPRLSSTSACRTTSRASTASSIDGNSEDESDIPTGRHSSYRHHPYQSHHSHQNRPRLSISPLDSHRASLYSRSYDDMGTVLRTSLSASDEGSNSNSYYDGDSRAPSMSPLTTSPSFTFIGQRQDREMADGSATGGLGASTGGGSQSAAPLSLDSLPSYPPDQKPPFSYPVLIRLAILGSPQKRLLLSQIYSAIEDKFPWYRDSAPKAWKASVRHCLSLNKEFVRMQRAVEDPGVGCGGWWSVGEGMKGLKRPRKRRPAQSKRDHEVDHASFVNAPAPSPLAIRRRHSSTFEDPPRVDPYPRYVSPFSSSSLPPMKAEPQTRPLVREPAMETLPSIEDYSLRLPPLQIPNPAQPLPTPPSSSRTVIFGNLGHAAERDRDTKGYTQGYSLHGGYKGARGSHTPTASSSSSYSTQSYGSASTSASSSSRPNPMSISSLLNDNGKPSGVVSGMLVESFDKMDVEMGDAHDRDNREVIPPKKRDQDVKMRTGEVTPFSSDQTLRPPSPEMDSPRSHGTRRSTTPVAPSGQRHRAQPRSSSRSGAHPPRPTRPPPPLPVDDASTTSRPTSERRSTKSTKGSRGA